MLTDARGLALTAASAAAVEALDATLAGFCGVRRDTGERLKRALALDPHLVMAHVLKGCFTLLFARRDLVPRAAQALAAAEAAQRSAGATPREVLHLAALRAWIAGDTHAARARWEALLREWPRDLAALKFAQHAALYHGDSAGMRQTIAAALPAWDAGVAGFGFVLGCHAFALEECGDYAEAERLGRAAVALDPADIWAAHAVAHVFEMTDRPDAGLAWIAACEPHWRTVNNFVFHAYWHRGLFLLALDRADEARACYDREVRAESTEDYLDIANAVALLWRLEEAGSAVGTRWAELARRAAERGGDHMLVFADVHYLIALAAAGDQAGVECWRAASEAFARSSHETAATVMAEVGCGLGAAALAHRQAAFARAVEGLLTIRERIVLIGGSTAQRDLFEQMLIGSALAAGDPATALALLAERLQGRPDNRWARAQAERARAALGLAPAGA